MTDVNQTPTPDGTGQQPVEPARTFTQADMDALAARIRAEVRDSTARRIAEQYGDLEALKTAKTRLDELEAAQLSEAEKLRKQLDSLNAERDAERERARQAELRAERLRVGQEMNLPVAMAERLIGDDADAMKADAQRLLDSLRAAGRPVLPDIHATEGALSGPAKTVKLTPEQERAVANAQKVDPKMTPERYLQRLQEMQDGG